MATLNLRRFTKPEILMAIQPRHLSQLLEPHAAYFEHRGIALPAPASNAPFPYGPVAQVLMTPDMAMPEDLVEALYYIHEMATPQGLEAIMEALEETPLGIDDNDDATALDMAIQVWLKGPRLLERLHAEQNLNRPRTFEYYCHPQSPGTLPTPDEALLRQIETDLDNYFTKKKRGRTARVYHYGRADGAWFLVRHGEPFKHEQIIKDGEAKCIFFRPAKFDVVVYDTQANEIRINARTKGERELYRKCFGRHLFQDDDHFRERSRFTLDPLTSDGPASLVCSDVPGIDWIRLKEIHLHWGGEFNEVEIRKADDLFASIERRGKTLPTQARVYRASFAVQFSSSNKPRTFVICSCNRLDLKRDDDGRLIEEWMRRRGFINIGEESDRAEAALMELA